MIFDEPGTYQIEYTATDECGNETVADRTVIVEEPPTYRTVLYTDGTFIINESSRDEAANVALHGQPTNIYDPFDPNGATNVDKYIFNSDNIPWNSEAGSVLSVEIGSEIHPTSTAYWFYGMSYCTSIDLSNLYTSAVTNMRYMFYCWRLPSLDVSGLDTSNVTDMSGMFYCCNALTELDLSSFDTSNVTMMADMFRQCGNLKKIYASSSFDVSGVTASDAMFAQMSNNLVGGAGTVWVSYPTDKVYAHIDGGVSDPGYFTAKN